MPSHGTTFIMWNRLRAIGKYVAEHIGTILGIPAGLAGLITAYYELKDRYFSMNDASYLNAGKFSFDGTVLPDVYRSVATGGAIGALTRTTFTINKDDTTGSGKVDFLVCDRDRLITNGKFAFGTTSASYSLDIEDLQIADVHLIANVSMEDGIFAVSQFLSGDGSASIFVPITEPLIEKVAATCKTAPVQAE